MGELRRIVCQKKYLLAVFVLLIANLFLFQYYQMDNLQALRDKMKRDRIPLMCGRKNRKRQKKNLLVK